MTFLQVFILAVLQGLTEFLPVSSSAHLAIARHFMPGFSEPGLALEIVVHLGTLVAVFIFFRKDFRALLGLGSDSVFAGHEQKALLFVVLASVPTGILGLTLRGAATRAFDSMLAVGAGLLLTGAALWAVERFTRRGKAGIGAGIGEMTWKQAVIVGVAQGIAVFPGVSRSGATITSALFSGMERRLAFTFSFVLSVPAILGATALEARDIAEAAMRPGELPLLVMAFFVAGAVGYATLGLLRRLVEGLRLTFFAYYCLILGAAALGVALAGA